MTVLPMLTALALMLGAHQKEQAAQPADPGRPTFEFRGIVAGQAIDRSLLQSCSPSQAGERCNLRESIFTNEPPPMIILEGGNLKILMFGFPVSQGSRLVRALTERYGPPCGQGSAPTLDLDGSVVNANAVYWCFAGGDLELQVSGREGIVTYQEGVRFSRDNLRF